MAEVSRQMSFPHAMRYAVAGHPIRRGGWSGGSLQWLVLEAGLWWLVTATTRVVVAAGDMSAVDFLARDYTILGPVMQDDAEFVCSAEVLAEPPGFPVGADGLDYGGPIFDVNDPGCKPLAPGLVRPDRSDSTVHELP